MVRDARLSALITQMRAAVLLPFGQRLSEPATLHIHTEGPPTAETFYRTGKWWPKMVEVRFVE